METTNKDFMNDPGRRGRYRDYNRGGRALAGVILIGIGVVLFTEQMGYYIPSWLFSWKMLLIAIGMFIGARHSFRGVQWLIPIFIGSAFLLDDLMPELSFRHYIWPVIIIFIGLFMIVRPRRRRYKDWRSDNQYLNPISSAATQSSDEEVIDLVSVFSHSQKNVISKNFKGGQITSSFGGTDLNLMQADFTGTITLEITNVFGGTKLLIPPHWNIKSEIVSVFGGVDDKRPRATEAVDTSKALRLVGTCFFGGIEIKSY